MIYGCQTIRKTNSYFENKDIGMVASDSIFSNNKDIRNLYKDGYPKDGYIFNDLPKIII